MHCLGAFTCSLCVCGCSMSSPFAGNDLLYCCVGRGWGALGSISCLSEMPSGGTHFIFAPANARVLIWELGLGWACPAAWGIRKDCACSCCSSGKYSRCSYCSCALYGCCSFLPTHSLELFSLLSAWDCVLPLRSCGGEEGRQRGIRGVSRIRQRLTAE